MNQRLGSVIDAHGGMERWRRYDKVEATIVTGGGFFALKGLMQDPAPRRMTVWLHEERSSVLPYGAPDQRTLLTPDRIAAEKLDGTVVAERRTPNAERANAERRTPSDSFAGHQLNTPGARCTAPTSTARSCELPRHAFPARDGRSAGGRGRALAEGS